VTPPNPLPNRADDEQAALWAARLDDSALAAADHAALDAWLAGDPARRTLLSQYCQFGADLERQLPSLVATGAVEMPADSPFRRHRPWLRWSAVGTLAAAAAAALMLWIGRPATQSENIATPMAQRQTLTLADGTRVDLNAQTSLRIEIARDERRVRLASGEAFFAVRKDAAWPFLVETPAGSVRVTGTQFSVRSDAAAEFEVTVVEGSVQARPGEADGRSAAPVRLAAGDHLSVGPGGVEVRPLSAAALDAALAWRQGRIVFDGVPLREALARFAHYHGRGITASANAADLRLGGRFSLDDLDGFFSALEEVLPVRVTHNLNGTVQVSLRAEH
jgi:transmembrane sensor